MDFDLNVKAFLGSLRLNEMTGQQKFLAVAALQAKGCLGTEVQTRDIQAIWPRSLLRQPYNPAFYDRAQREGWVDPSLGRKGVFALRQNGLDHLSALEKLAGVIHAGNLQKSGALVVVNRRAAHTFDKYLRNIFSAARLEVLIADSYVDETIFDTVLDVIPQTASIKLLYGRGMNGFDVRAKRFAQEWNQFTSRRYKPLHDRFLVIDKMGYFLGPSIKDAASQSPALVVELASKENQLLKTFFNGLWQQAKP